MLSRLCHVVDNISLRLLLPLFRHYYADAMFHFITSLLPSLPAIIFITIRCHAAMIIDIAY